MSSLSEQLRTRIILPDGTVPRGAISRIAEATGVRPATARRWILFGSEPSIHVADAVRRLLKRKKIEVAAMRTGRTKISDSVKC